MLAERGSGSVVNASSVAGTVGAPNHAAYGANKGAVRTLTKDAAAEYASRNVRVNSIHPGYIRTAMSEYASATTHLSPDELGQMYPLGRLGEPTEVAKRFCSSLPMNRVHHRCRDPIDGGFTAQQASERSVR